MKDKEQFFLERLYECSQHKKRLLKAKMYLKDRNEIAHEYSFNQDEVVDGINLIFERIDDLLKIY